MSDHPPSRIQSSEAGGALWFILIAIALLVALTLTITKSTDNAQQNGTRERDRIQASQILRQAKGMATAIDNARMQSIPENNISFENPDVTGYAMTFTSATIGSTQAYGLFFSSGAGLTYHAPASDWLDPTKSAEPHYGEWFFYGTTCIPGVGRGDSASCLGDERTSELMVSVPWINESLCIEINRQAGVANLANPTRPPSINTAGYGSATQFIGTYGAGGLIFSSGSEFSGKQAGCYAGGSADPDGGYHFFEVLIAR